MVGGSSDIFTRPALGLLVRKSRGIPRRINILCHNSMLFAYGKDLERVNRSIVAQAVRDVDGHSLF
jgi:MSHA biogenesis protein MshM